MNLLMGTVILSLAFASGYDQATSAASRSSSEPPRVRTADATVAGTMRQALEVSPTFRRLAEAIQATDGIVYVERGSCDESATGCLRFGSVAGPNRILRVTLSAKRRDVDAGTIAHELQHAVEVLQSPGVTFAVAMTSFYLRVGVSGNTSGRTRETAAAIAAGNAVRAEMRAANRAAARRRLDAAPADVIDITASR